MNTRDFIYRLPSRVPADAIRGQETTFHFDFEGEGGGQYTVEVKNDQVIVHDGLHGTPSCTIRATNENFLKLLRGDLNPMMAILTGKIKISNQAELLRYAKMFGLM